MIVTRRWDHNINTAADGYRSTPNQTLHEVNDGYEVYRLPYIANLRDNIYVQHGEERKTGIRKLLSLAEVLLQGFFTSVLPYKNLFDFALEYAGKHKPDACIVSGNPFVTFKAGYQIHKKFGVPWVADYRDAWTTTEINFINRSPIYKLINIIERYFEKKWTRTAAKVTASSAPIAKGIEQVTGTPSTALYNGFIATDFDGIGSDKFAEFTVTYVGTIYYGQKIEIFCNAFIRLIDQNPDIKAKLLLPGMMYYKEQHERINRIMQGYEQYVECTPRMDRQKILEIEKKSHLLLHVAWDEQSGIIASKIYEYLASGTPILVTPTDRGSIEEIVQTSGCGTCTTTMEETLAFLQQEYLRYAKGEIRRNNTVSPNVIQFSRQEQVKRLAELLNSLPSR